VVYGEPGLQCLGTALHNFAEQVPVIVGAV